MKRILIILIAGMLLCSAVSLAENTPADISGEGYDCMYYQCTLPDGRVILTGWQSTPGNWQDSRARILRLNPDMTVSWEYRDPAEGFCGFTRAAVLKNGRIGVVFENSPGQETEEIKLKFFDTDGRPAGEEISLPVSDGLVYGATASCIWLRGYSSTWFIDWEGNTVFQFSDEKSPLNGCDRMTETEDGLVFAGCSSEDEALLIKLDFRGELLWETRIPASEQAGMEGANLTDCMKTEDGGYLAQLVEYGSEISAYRYLVKFGADGLVAWKNADAFDRCPETWLNGLVMHNGILVAEMMGSSDEYGMNGVGTYVWMDGNGNWLGTTDDINPGRAVEPFHSGNGIRRPCKTAGQCG